MTTQIVIIDGVSNTWKYFNESFPVNNILRMTYRVVKVLVVDKLVKRAIDIINTEPPDFSDIRVFIDRDSYNQVCQRGETEID